VPWNARYRHRISVCLLGLPRRGAGEYLAYLWYDGALAFGSGNLTARRLRNDGVATPRGPGTGAWRPSLPATDLRRRKLTDRKSGFWQNAGIHLERKADRSGSVLPQWCSRGLVVTNNDDKKIKLGFKVSSNIPMGAVILFFLRRRSVILAPKASRN
jgi:hypothetical protein